MRRHLALLALSVVLLGACAPAQISYDEAHLLRLADRDYALSWRAQVQELSSAYTTTAAAEAAGYISVQDTQAGPIEHFARWDWVEDDRIMDPTHPEMLAYLVGPDGRRTLVAYAFMLPGRYGFSTVPEIAGRPGNWHFHPGVCLRGDPLKNPSDGVALPTLADAEGRCLPGAPFPTNLMAHAWVVPNRCGPFDVARDPAGRAVPEAVAGVDHTGHIPPCDEELARLVWPELAEGS